MSPPAKLSEEVEDRLAAAVANVLGVRAVRRDRRTGARIRDFDLHGFVDRPDEPLEVTWFARAAVIQTWDRLHRDDWHAPSLSRTWIVNVPNEGPAGGPLDAQRFRRAAELAIAELEREDYEQFDTRLWFQNPAAKDPLLRLGGLGCFFGRSSPTPVGEISRIHPVASAGGRVDDDLVPQAVEAEAAKLDNREKLAQPPGALRRHLLVYVHSSTGVAFSAASHGTTGRLPVLPEPITTAWVASGGDMLMVTTPPGPWETHRIPNEVFEHPQRWIED